MPDDDTEVRDTPVKLHGRTEAGYVSYFMESRTIPAFDSTLYSGMGKLYWRTGEANADDNVDISGVTVDECHELCHITTDGLCFVFRSVFQSAVIYSSHFLSFYRSFGLSAFI